MEHQVGKELLTYYNQDISAKAGLETIYALTQEEGIGFAELFHARDALLSKEPHNIVLRNITEQFLSKQSRHNLGQEAGEKKQRLQEALDEAEKNVAIHVSKKIKKGSTAFFHSLNHHLVSAEKHTSKHKNFWVNLVDNYPLNFGSLFHNFLQKNRKNSKLFFDLAMEKAVAESDACFLGADAVTNKGNSIVKTGSQMAADMAAKNRVPLYVCAPSWKFDFRGEAAKHFFKEKEIKNRQGHIFEELPKNKITAYITENGIFKPDQAFSELKIHGNLFNF